LAAAELVDARRCCPICLTAAPRRAVFRVQAAPDVDMLECPCCRASSASSMPGPDVLAEYYASYYDDRDAKVTFSAPSRFARHVVGLLPDVASNASVRILDFGGGDGSLSRAIAERLIALGRTSGAEVLVVDFAPHDDVTDAGVSIRYRPPAETIDGRYDLVLASAILEHIPDLNPVLATLHAAMAPAGFFYARTPYVIPLTRLFPRLDLTYPAHVHDMGSEFWNRFSETFGWDTRIVVSRPSVVAGSLLADPVRTLAAAALKTPAHVENFFSPRTRARRWWNLVGGWEVLLQKKETRQGRVS
jgi:SAM-dependent methyltransferase